jgi:hypothetical protein
MWARGSHPITGVKYQVTDHSGSRISCHGINMLIYYVVVGGSDQGKCACDQRNGLPVICYNIYIMLYYIVMLYKLQYTF